MTSGGRPAENSSVDRNASPTAVRFKPPARLSTSLNRAPFQRAVEIKSQPKTGQTAASGEV